MAKPRLTIIANTLEGFGGGERWSLETATSLEESIDFTIINPTAKDSIKRKSIEEIRQDYKGDYKIVDVPCKSKFVYSAHFLMVFPMPIGIYRIGEAIRKSNVVYQLSMNPFLVAYSTFFAKLYGKRIILGLGNPLLLRSGELRELRQSWKEHLLQNILLTFMDEIHVQAESQMRIIKAYGYNGKLHFCPQPVWARSVSKPILHKGFRCLWVGRLDTGQKGIDHLVNIIDNVLAKNDKISFNIVGSGEGQKLIEGLVARHKEKVKYHGFVSEKKLEGLYNSSDLFIFPSRYETPGLSLIESQVHGLPCVAFRVQGSGDVIKNKVQGTLIEPFNVEQFAEAIIKESKYKSQARKNKIKKIISNAYSKQKFKRRFKKMILGE